MYCIVTYRHSKGQSDQPPSHSCSPHRHVVPSVFQVVGASWFPPSCPWVPSLRGQCRDASWLCWPRRSGLFHPRFQGTRQPRPSCPVGRGIENLRVREPEMLLESPSLRGGEDTLIPPPRPPSLWLPEWAPGKCLLKLSWGGRRWYPSPQIDGAGLQWMLWGCWAL